MKNIFQNTKKNYEEADAWHREKSLAYNWDAQIDSFTSALPKGAKILDVGSGSSGRDLTKFKQRGFVVEGLDYSAPAVAALRAQFPDSQFYEADMRATDLPDASYEGVWASASILNVPKADVPATLAEFNRLLKTGGELFISVKAGEGEKAVPDKAGERFFSFFTTEELQQLVRDAGFEVWKVEELADSWFTGKEPQPDETVWICLYAVK